MTRLTPWLVTALILLTGRVGADSADSLFLVPEPGYEWSFPRDHTNHGRYALEWWYYTGHLLPDGADAAADSNWAHFQLTFFRNAVPANNAGQLYFAHFTISGPGMEFRFAERIARGTLGEAGARGDMLHTWLDDWRVTRMPDGAQFLEAHDDSVGGLRLLARPTFGPVLNGDNGLSRKGPDESEASYYYSMPRMNVTGWLIPRGDGTAPDERREQTRAPVPVTGSVWMDHEFGNQKLGEGLVGWDWWGLQLPGGGALMLYRIRRADGGAIPQSEGTFISAAGSRARIPWDQFELRVLGTWTSPHTGVEYPHGWVLEAPGFVHPDTGERGLSLTIRPVRDDQELRTESSTRVTYYEGAVTVRRDGFDRRSFGFVELVGYDAEQSPEKTRPLDTPVTDKIIRGDE